MSNRIRAAIGLLLVAASSALAGYVVSIGFGAPNAQSGNPGGASAAASSSDNTGYLSPSAEKADTGGDNNGFELNPAFAFVDGPVYAANNDGFSDRHLFYGYGISLPAGSTIDGIRLRLDWWLGGDVGGDNSLGVDLSWDGGAHWTPLKIDATESVSEHTAILGGVGDTWGRLWTGDELGDGNFRLRVSCHCSGGVGCESRDYYLDWVAVNVFYTPP